MNFLSKVVRRRLQSDRDSGTTCAGLTSIFCAAVAVEAERLLEIVEKIGNVKIRISGGRISNLLLNCDC